MLLDPSFLQTVRRRRAELREALDIDRMFSELEESCVPSYCHPNRLAAAVAWARLSIARDLYRRYAVPGPILDFGAASGELLRLLDTRDDLHFVEENEGLAELLARGLPAARPRP